MFRFTKNKKTQRVAALALAATIAASVFVFGPKKKVQAAPITRLKSCQLLGQNRAKHSVTRLKTRQYF